MPDQLDQQTDVADPAKRAEPESPVVPTPILLSRTTVSPPPLPRNAPPRPIQLETVARTRAPLPPRATPTPVPRSSVPATGVPVPPPAPVPRQLVVPDGTIYTGEVLRSAREALGLSVEQMCERTRITRQHVENLEADRYDRLPAGVYLRGMLMAMAKELRLDAQKVARSYLEALAVTAAQQGKSR